MSRKAKRTPEQKAADKRMAAKLDALYAELPSLECKGLCTHSCIPVEFAPGERARIGRERGADVPSPAQMERAGEKACPLLVDGRCSVYEIRPMICRLWGIDESMPCPHGCKPRGGWLARTEGHRFSIRAYVIAGWPPGFPKMTPKQIAAYTRNIDTHVPALGRDRAQESHEDEPPPRRRGLGLRRRFRSG